jgi:hypothetical protein
MVTNQIVCRAKVSKGCLDGLPTRAQFPVEYMGDGTLDPPMPEDGTFDGESIVCDLCYLAMGCPTNEEMPHAIRAARNR